MGLKDEISDRILEVFYEFPEREFTIRELAKLTSVPKSTVQGYISGLKQKGLVTEGNRAAETKLFKVKKINYYIERIVESGLIEYLEEELTPSCIILFGSFRKGESTKESDIDIFVESTKKGELEVEKFEKKLKHGIQFFIEQDIKKLQPHLLNNVVNGIKLSGSFKVK